MRLKNGDPDFKRRFYSKECLAKDKRRRTAFARELVRRRQPAPLAAPLPASAFDELAARLKRLEDGCAHCPRRAAVKA